MSELKEFVVIAVYLFICFTVLASFKAAVLHANGIAFAPFGIAAVKALICAKFVSIGHAFHVGERFKSMPLIWPTLYRSLLFLLLLLALNIAEEVLVGLIHRRGVVESILDIAGGTLGQLVAASMVVLLILIPFFAFRTLGEVVGEQNLVHVFLYGYRGRTTKA